MNDLQNAILNIYKITKEIFDSNGISYFAYSGTAIGAVRHGGFIPWDDDLDLILPMSDFNRAIKILEEQLPDYLEVRMARSDVRYAHFFVKVVDNRTTFIEDKEIGHPDLYKGVWIDLFPLCSVPDDKKLRHRIFKHNRLLHLLHSRIFLPSCYANSKISKIFTMLVSPFKVFISYDCFYNRWLKLASYAESFNGEYVCDISNSSLNSRPEFIFKKSWFSDFVDMPFEDTLIRMPISYHDYLTHQYGNYMQIPDVCERAKHDGVVDLNVSYKLYSTSNERI